MTAFSTIFLASTGVPIQPCPWAYPVAAVKRQTMMGMNILLNMYCHRLSSFRSCLKRPIGLMKRPAAHQVHCPQALRSPLAGSLSATAPVLPLCLILGHAPMMPWYSQ